MSAFREYFHFTSQNVLLNLKNQINYFFLNLKIILFYSDISFHPLPFYYKMLFKKLLLQFV